MSSRSQQALFIAMAFAVSLLLSIRTHADRDPARPASPDEATSLRAGIVVTPSPTATVAPMEPNMVWNLPWPMPTTMPVRPGARGVSVDEIEALVRMEDPVVLDPSYAPRVVDATARGKEGPALAIAGVNEVMTLDFGAYDRRARPTRIVTLRNVGDAPLTISRIYAGCSCVERRLPGPTIGPAGWLEPALVLSPAESVDLELSLRLDSGEITAGTTRAFYLQIFTDDVRTTKFDADDPASHEVRLRLVAGHQPWPRATRAPTTPGRHFSPFATPTLAPTDA